MTGMVYRRFVRLCRFVIHDLPLLRFVPGFVSNEGKVSKGRFSADVMKKISRYGEPALIEAGPLQQNWQVEVPEN